MRENQAEQTIAAVSTARAAAAISLIRVSGTLCSHICNTLFRGAASPLPSPRTLIHGAITDPATAQIVDRVLISFFPNPKSYTGEDMLEIHTHGGNYVTNRVFQLVVDSGARPAYPGEFTLRAFANAKLDLTQAEAVLDVIHARNEQFLAAAQRNLAGHFGYQIHNVRDIIMNLLASIEVVFEYPDDDVPDVSHDVVGESLKKAIDSIENLLKSYKPESLVNSGLKIGLLGRPNVGKSSIMNCVLGYDRSITHESPGTTRDLIGEWTDLYGFDIMLMDTAGVTPSENPVEAEGVRRTKAFIEQEAHEIMVVFDGSQPLDSKDFELIDYVVADIAPDKPVIPIVNKIDLPVSVEREQIETRLGTCLETSALTGHGIEDLKNRLKSSAEAALASISDLLFSNIRHKLLLERAQKSLTEAFNAIDSVPQDILCIDIREAADCLSEITGQKVSDDILDNIFSNFCVGK